MTEPLLSICVPTWNRARYLDCLLDGLTLGLDQFPYSVEVFISDNGSTDQTPGVVQKHAGRLPLRYVRHESNRGGPFNYDYVLRHARGRYVCYLADDDTLDCSALARAVTRLLDNPDAGVLYAPWRLHDLITDQDQGQFYRIERFTRIERGDHPTLLRLILAHSIFPEIAICAREVVLATQPRLNDHAFWAFVHAAEFLSRAPVLFDPEPFYISITGYFADEQRVQHGAGEAAVAWDRYRGGLEYILARAGTPSSSAERQAFREGIDRMIGARLAVAARLRMSSGADPVDTYFLAQRAKALGAEAALPAPMQAIASMAALHFIATDALLLQDRKRLHVIGPFETPVVDFTRARSKLPLEQCSLNELSNCRDAVVLLHGSVPMEPAQRAVLLERNVHVLTESELAAKFPC